jgi:hypothetical protein
VTYRFSNEGSGSEWNVSGIGTSLSLFGTYSKNRYGLTMEFTDLGMIRWNAQSTYLQADTSFRFEGIVLNNIYDSLSIRISDSTFVYGALNRKGEESFVSIIPATFHLSGFYDITDKAKATLGIRYRFFAVNIPQTYLMLQYRFSETFSCGFSARYGGYGSLNAGLHLEKKIGRWELGAGSHALDGLLLPAYGTGGGVYLRIGVQL